jgi:hypothetical protein
VSAAIINIDVVDETNGLLPGGWLAAWLAAVQLQVTRDAAPFWEFPPVVFSIQPAIRSGNWGCAFLPNSDVADALGYHDDTADGLPMAKIFYETTVQDKEDPAVTGSHEILEMLVDPGINDTARDSSDGWLYAKEVCDAVEETTYQMFNGVNVSNFQLPSWFGLPNPVANKAYPAGSYDFLGKCTQAFQLLAGGYMPVQKRGRGWTQIFGSIAAEDKFRSDRKWRGRVREKGVRVRSTR